MFFRALLLGVSLLAMSHPAEAAPPVCNTTSEGTIVYNKAHLTMQFCNGTNWIAMSGNFGGGGGADNLGDHIATTVLRSDTHNTDDLGTTAIRWKDGWFAGTVTGGTFAGSGASLTALNATNLASGTVPDARFPATLPAVSGANLTNLDASDLATGTVPTARLGSGTANNTTYLRGDGTWQTVPAGADNLGNHIATQNIVSDTHNTDDLGTTAIRWKDGWFAGTVTGGTFAGSGASLTALNATNLASGTVATARLGTGTANNTTYLRGDGTWQTVPAGADNLGNHIATQNIVSDTHNTDDLGTTAVRWKDGWFAGTVTGGTFAGSGASLTALNASNLTTGTVATARLGTGTANSSVFLRGDGTWAAPAGDNLGAGGTTVGTLYSSNASGYGYIGSEGGATGAYMRFDGSPAASAGNIYVNLLGTWEYRFNAGYFGPYATNLNDLGSSTVKWADGFFAGNVNAAAYLHTSDERMKKDIVDIEDPMALINGLRGVHYKWKENDKPAYGLIAQEVEKVVPDAVDTDDQGMKSVEYDQIIAPLVEAVKAQQKQIEELKAEVQALKSKGE